jgi:uncharacterized protein with PQ loop repeat
MLELRHLFLRKKKLNDRPQTVRTVVKLAWLDMLIYVASVVGPLATLPQVLKIYVTRDAEGLALVSWTAYAALNVVWILYGYKHKEKPIIIANIASLILNATVVAGIIFFS